MVITLTGTNSFLLQHELDGVVAGFLAEHDAIGLERIDGEESEFERISEALTSLPFLASKKLIILRTGSANKKFVEQAEALLSDMPETTDLVIIEPKLDKRSVYYKYLKRATTYKECNELDLNGLARWLTAQAQVGGVELQTADARYLVERVGLNQQLLSHELDKLCLYSGSGEKGTASSRITRQTIDLLTEPAPQSTIFELLEAAFAGNARRAMALYQEQRTLKVEPQQIIALLAWQLHILALVKTAGSRTPDQVAKEAKISPYVAKKTVGIARTTSLTQLKDLIATLLTIDSRLKRESLDADEVLRTYLLKLAS
jgi:DNA polymerase III subunit delta